MPDAFEPALERWHDFYMLAGATSGVLLGLLFVSVSEHLNVLTRDARALAIAEDWLFGPGPTAAEASTLGVAA